MKKTIFYFSFIMFLSGCIFVNNDNEKSIIKTTAMYYSFIGTNSKTDTMDIYIFNKFYLSLSFDYEYETFFSNAPMEFNSRIQSITITSSADYNEDYPKGKNLCNVLHLTYIKRDGDGFIENPVDYNTFIMEEDNFRTPLNFYFTEEPDSSRLHVLSIKYEEDNGTIYNLVTYPIYITP